MRMALGALAMVITWTMGSTVAAQAAPDEGIGEADEGIGLEVEDRLAVHPGKIGHSAPSVAIDVLGARYEGVEPIAFGLELPVAAFGVPGAEEEDEGLRIGNPALEVGWVTELGDLELGVGVGAALPLAHADDEMQHFGYELADSVDAGWDMWSWIPDRLTFFVPVEAEWEHGRLAVEGELAAGYLIDTGDEEADPELVVQGRLGAGYAVGPLLRPGVRAQVVWTATAEEGQDAAQLAVEPYLRLADEGAFAELSVMLPIDAPYGYLGEGERLWSLHVGVGAEL